MSQRTIVEFNHDLVHRIDEHSLRFTCLIGDALASGSPADWEALEGFGIRRVVQCHHSDERKVVVRGHEYLVG